MSTNDTTQDSTVEGLMFPRHVQYYLNNDAVRQLVAKSNRWTQQLKEVRTFNDLREIADQLKAEADGFYRCADTWEGK